MKTVEFQEQLTDAFKPDGPDYQNFVVSGYNSLCRFIGKDDTVVLCHRATVRRQGEELLPLLAHHSHMQYVRKPDGKLGERATCDACQAQWEEADRKLDSQER